MAHLPDLTSLFEHAACGLLVTDPDGTIRKVNSTFCRWLGYDAVTLTGEKRIQELFTMGGRFFHHTHWAPLLQMQGSVAEVQMDMVCRDGTPLPMIINVVRRKHGADIFDELAVFVATDRKQYERELLNTRRTAETSLAALSAVQLQLQESRDVLGIAIHSAQMGVWSRNLQSGCVWWSSELEQLVGLAEASFPETIDAFDNLIHEDDRARFHSQINQALAESSDYAVEFRLLHTNGQWRTMEGRGRATYDDAGKPQTLFGIVIDITERQLAEDKLRELNEQLSLADRRKDEFLATLAHELRNPLAPMRNVLEILRLKTFDDPLIHWSRDIIERNVQQMTHLVDDLMEVSRITQGRLELRKTAVSLIDIMHHAIETASALMEKSGHQLTVSLPNDDIILDADATRLIQVISNLLTNAAKYTPSGGEISLEARVNAGEVLVKVRDSGIGIPKEHLSNVFEMFSQLTPALERSQGGLGIGLALVRGLVELHGGTIHAESPGVNQGSEFVVCLPLPERKTTIPTVVRPTITTSTKCQRVLVVDDNIDSAESLALALELLGYVTRTADNGLGGLKVAQEFSPEVILLDIGLPDINGYEVARRIRSASWGQEMFLIAATGWAQDKDKERATAAGLDCHLTKPIDFYELDKILALATEEA